MPRRRRNDNHEFIDPDTHVLNILTDAVKITVQPHLKDTYYDMAKRLNHKLNCAVCMDDLNCKHCFCLLVCGHFIHTDCFMRMPDNKCPICRHPER